MRGLLMGALGTEGTKGTKGGSYVEVDAVDPADAVLLGAEAADFEGFAGADALAVLDGAEEEDEVAALGKGVGAFGVGEELHADAETEIDAAGVAVGIDEDFLGEFVGGAGVVAVL